MPTELSLAINFCDYPALVVGLSGGLDSVVLLHRLSRYRQQYNFSLRAIHVHHGISENADYWLEHCQQLCRQWQIPLRVQKVQLTGRKQGIEAEARQLRYEVFARALEIGESLVTAHHRDDQCETLLLAIKRGSGPAGLASMPALRRTQSYHHLRPLLTYSRQQLEHYALEQQLTWIEDESNGDDHYDRNFLRLKVLPLLTERWPQFSRMATRSAELCGEQEALLDELLADQLAQAMHTDNSLSIEALQTLSEIRRNALIRRWLNCCDAPLPTRQALVRIWQEVALSRADATPHLFLQGGFIRRYQQRLYWSRAYSGQRTTKIEWLTLQQALLLPDDLGQLSLQPSSDGGLEIRAPKENERVSIRFHQTGHLHLVGRRGGRSLKKIWQELGIPPWLRDSVPLLFYDDTLICAVGIFVTEAGRNRDETGWQLVWQGKNPELNYWLQVNSEHHISSD